MADIQVKKNGPQPSTPMRPLATWDPSRWFARMAGFDPFREMMPLLAEERLVFDPAFEIKETIEGYLFKADLPGVKLSDVDVSLTQNRLQISGKREAEKEEKGDTFYTYERSYGSFTRAFTLPEGVDGAKVHADLRDGVLTVLVPKKVESMARKIPVAGAPAEPKKS